MTGVGAKTLQSGGAERRVSGSPDRRPSAELARTEPFDAVTVNDRSWREHVMSLHALQGTVRPLTGPAWVDRSVVS